MTRLVLLGPQRDQQTVGQTLDDLGIRGRVATITAGWQEWESDDAALNAQIGRPTVNLELYARAERVWSADPELRAAHREMQDKLRRLRSLYNRRLAHAAGAWIELLDDRGPEDLLAPERAHALEVIRGLDEHHLVRVAETARAFEQEWQPGTREAVQSARASIEKSLEGCEAVVIEGGHVALLRNRMHLFGLTEAIGDRTVIACSGGAMALGERIVLFHDSPPSGPGNTEVALTGLGMYKGLVPLPHARTRLRLDDERRVKRLADRFAPDTCVVLEAGTRIDWDGKTWTPVQAARITSDGVVGKWARVA